MLHSATEFVYLCFNDRLNKKYTEHNVPNTVSQKLSLSCSPHPGILHTFHFSPSLCVLLNGLISKDYSNKVFSHAHRDAFFSTQINCLPRFLPIFRMFLTTSEKKHCAMVVQML